MQVVRWCLIISTVVYCDSRCYNQRSYVVVSCVIVTGVPFHHIHSHILSCVVVSCVIVTGIPSYSQWYTVMCCGLLCYSHRHLIIFTVVYCHVLWSPVLQSQVSHHIYSPVVCCHMSPVSQSQVSHHIHSGMPSYVVVSIVFSHRCPIISTVIQRHTLWPISNQYYAITIGVPSYTKQSCSAVHCSHIYKCPMHYIDTGIL